MSLRTVAGIGALWRPTTGIGYVCVRKSYIAPENVRYNGPGGQHDVAQIIEKLTRNRYARSRASFGGKRLRAAL